MPTNRRNQRLQALWQLCFVLTPQEPAGAALPTEASGRGPGARLWGGNSHTAVRTGMLRSGDLSALWVLAETPDRVHSPVDPCLPQVSVPRGAWDDSAGYVALTKYATAEARTRLEAGMLQAAPSGYLAHAAAGALLRWVLSHSWWFCKVATRCPAGCWPCSDAEENGDSEAERAPIPPCSRHGLAMQCCPLSGPEPS